MLDAEQLRDSLNLAAIVLRDAKGFHEVNIGRVQLGGFSVHDAVVRQSTAWRNNASIARSQ
jgi:hypothetical protein